MSSLEKPAILALADGTVFRGVSFGAEGETAGEVVFNTSMTGYQEILTDPSYRGQLVCMGVHTGDSITVAPAQTLTDKEYQVMRQAALAIIREIGVDTGGSNIQFGINPRDGRMGTSFQSTQS